MLTPEEYRNILQMSPKKRVLVEGRDDFYLLLALFDELLGSDWQDTYNIEIEKSDILTGAPEKKKVVELTVNLVSKTNLRDKIVGFVDREFNEFTWENGILTDLIKKHFIDDRILWTRGHSAENYFLDESILRIPFRDVSGEIFQKSYAKFKKNFYSYLRVACKLSLTAKNLEYLTRIRPSIKWEVIKEDGDLDLEQWKIQLSSVGFKPQDIDKIITTYLMIEDVINSADIETVRWFCDGHLSFFLLWCAFARCAYDATELPSDKRAIAQRILKYKDDLRFNSCASAWAKSAQSNSCEYPKEIFTLLNLNQEKLS